MIPGRIGKYISIALATATGFLVLATAEVFFRHPGWAEGLEGATVAGRGAIFLLIAYLTNPLIMGIVSSYIGLMLLTFARMTWLELNDKPRTTMDQIVANTLGGVLSPIQSTKKIAGWLRRGSMTLKGIASAAVHLG